MQISHETPLHPKQVPGESDQGGDRAHDIRDRGHGAGQQDRDSEPPLIPGPARHQVCCYHVLALVYCLTGQVSFVSVSISKDASRPKLEC